ncbi:transposase family protein [Streptomyces sp. NPDC001393]
MFCAHSAAPTARCSRCGVVSWRVHGRYARPLADAPVGGASAVIELVAHRRGSARSREKGQWAGRAGLSGAVTRADWRGRR